MSLSKFVFVALVWGSYGYAEEERITNDGSNKRDPIFIAQGKTLVYCLDEKDDLIRAVSLDLSDPESEPVPLFDDDRSHQTELAYSPDERFVSFSECVGNLTGKLVIRDLGPRKMRNHRPFRARCLSYASVHSRWQAGDLCLRRKRSHATLVGGFGREGQKTAY